MIRRYFTIRKGGAYLQSPLQPYVWGAIDTAYIWSERDYIDEDIGADIEDDKEVVEVTVTIRPLHTVDPCNRTPET